MEVDLTKQEIIKIEGRFLRGDLSQDLKGPKNKVSNPSSELLKFHGIYQGLDRDKKREEKNSKDSSSKTEFNSEIYVNMKIVFFFKSL